jgi:hypothetical protein
MKIFKIRNTLVTLMFLITFIMGLSTALAQQTTEQFIPIGKSPGISGKRSYIGSITAINKDANQFTLHSDRGLKTIRVTPLTMFWLDRSKIKQSNLEASFKDCDIGKTVEVLPDRGDDDVAIWVKIESQ